MEKVAGKGGTAEVNRLERALSVLAESLSASVRSSAASHAATLKQIRLRARPPARPRRPSLVRVHKQAARAGIEVAQYRIEPDGTMVVVPGKADAAASFNEWDEVLPDGKTTEIH